jgi:UDP-N-acetylglucosamine--N-acetylmuramyl-(pentapeptide) pyrophosphoryl-undecaprenol N-acetylglucosamine transferase
MTVAIAAGGTGGHLYPAVALAKEFLRHDSLTRILFIGTKRGLEAKVLAHEGFELALITAHPVMGKRLVTMLRGMASLPIGVWQSLALFRRMGVNLVIGVGGYTSPAVLVAAALRRIPRVILEPNAYPGMANKVVAPLAQRIFLAFDSAGWSFDRRKVVVTGTPIRREFVAQEAGEEVLFLHSPPRLLIFGGSQGAKAINDEVLEGMTFLIKQVPGVEITHQTGELDYQRVKEGYERLGVRAEIAPFLYDMPTILRTADLVVARAGAMTIAELTACGKPAILVPLPTAIYDHQMKNAQAMEEGGGAVVLPQAELTGLRLSELIVCLLSNPERLRGMGVRSRAMRRIDAGEAIVRECYRLVREAPNGHGAL